MSLRGLFSRREAPPAAEPEVPQRRHDARVYVANGDNIWGNSITFRQFEENRLSVIGWLSRAPFPRVGDVLLVRMTSGKWGEWIFVEAKLMQGVSDGFMGEVVGAFGYHEPAPSGNRPDELIENLSSFVRV